MFSAFGAATVWWGFTAYFDPLITEFGWSHTAISFSASLQATESGLGAIFAGLLIHRFGTRKIVIGGTFLTTAGFLLLSRVNSLPVFYFSYLLIGMGVTSAGSVVMLPLISRFFRDRVALAFGLFSTAGGAAGFALPVIVGLLDTIGFRKTFVVFAVIALALGLGVSALVGKAKHASVPEAAATERIATGRRREENRTNPSARDMLHSRVFWSLVAFFAAHFIAIQMVVAHVMPYLESIGYERGPAAGIAMSVPVLSLVGRLGFGWLGERFNRLHIITLAVLLNAVALGSLALTGPGLAVVVFLGIFAVSMGILVPGRATILSDYFHPGYFAVILGLMMGIGSFAGMLGPVGGGWVYDQTGSYRLPLIIASVLLVAAALLLMTSGQLRERFGRQRRDLLSDPQ